MAQTIEQIIIAYFDRRLTEAERMDLFQKVHSDPHVRMLFSQHENLRGLVRTAQQKIVIDADTESSLFAKILAAEQAASYSVPATASTVPSSLSILQSIDKVQSWVLPFVVESLSVAAVLCAFMIGSHSAVQSGSGAQAIRPRDRSDLSANGAYSRITQRSTESPVTAADAFSRITIGTDIRDARLDSKSAIRNRLISSNDESESVDNGPTSSTPSYTIRSPTHTDGAFSNAKDDSEVTLSSAGPLSVTIAQPGGLLAPSMLSDQQLDLPRARFKIALDGFANTNEHIDPLGTVRVAGAYSISRDNWLGIRVSDNTVRWQPIKPAVVPVTASREKDGSTRTVLGEAFYEHDFALVSNKLYLTSLVAAGFESRAMVVSAEMGIEVPLMRSASAVFGCSLARFNSMGSVTRTNDQTGQTFQRIDTHDPLQWRLTYGINYIW